jgi:hypothetical protein
MNFPRKENECVPPADPHAAMIASRKPHDPPFFCQQSPLFLGNENSSNHSFKADADLGRPAGGADGDAGGRRYGGRGLAHRLARAAWPCPRSGDDAAAETLPPQDLQPPANGEADNPVTPEV